MKWLGRVMVVSLYALLAYHVYVYFGYIITPLVKKVGSTYAMIWMAIGLSFVYNISFNHFMAMILKPGSVKDLRKDE
jgi:hypothetical protein